MPSPTQQKSVLIVDDEPRILDTMRQTLEANGYRVTCMLSGNEAVVQLRRERFDIVITDILMPDVDGAQVVIIARQHQPNVRIIAMSGGGMYMTAPEALQLSRKLGAMAVLEKPFTPDQLLAAIEF